MQSVDGIRKEIQFRSVGIAVDVPVLSVEADAVYGFLNTEFPALSNFHIGKVGGNGRRTGREILTRNGTVENMADGNGKQIAFRRDLVVDEDEVPVEQIDVSGAGVARTVGEKLPVPFQSFGVPVGDQEHRILIVVIRIVDRGKRDVSGAGERGQRKTVAAQGIRGVAVPGDHRFRDVQHVPRPGGIDDHIIKNSIVIGRDRALRGSGIPVFFNLMHADRDAGPAGIQRAEQQFGRRDSRRFRDRRKRRIFRRQRIRHADQSDVLMSVVCADVHIRPAAVDRVFSHFDIRVLDPAAGILRLILFESGIDHDRESAVIRPDPFRVRSNGKRISGPAGIDRIQDIFGAVPFRVFHESGRDHELDLL